MWGVECFFSDGISINILLDVFCYEPGEFVVIVSDEYVADSDVAVPPVAGTVLLRVPELGSGGLLNSGERLLLRAPDGEVASRFAAIKPKPGISVARRWPWSLDDDEQAFGLHQDPGASPGAANRLR